MIYDDFARSLARDYQLFLTALTGRYLALASAGVEVSPMSIRSFETAASALRMIFLDIAARTVKDYVSEGQRASVGAYGQSVVFTRQLELLTAQNVEALVNRMRGMKLDALDAIKERMHGAMGLLLQRQMSQPTYTVTTPSGRNFDAMKLLTTEARHFAYQIWVRAELMRLAADGDLAEVRYPDHNHENDGLIFSISGQTPGHPSFDSIEESVFHYNSSAMVATHVPR